MPHYSIQMLILPIKINRQLNKYRAAAVSPFDSVQGEHSDCAHHDIPLLLALAEDNLIQNHSTSPILFFDGVCNLCNGFVQFIIRHDKNKLFLFAPLQSAAGKAAMHNTPQLPETAAGSVILLYKGVWHVRSSAALRICRLLGWPWVLLCVGYIAPRILRDGIYNIIARNRYKWFGKRDRCMVPGPEIRDRFISQ